MYMYFVRLMHYSFRLPGSGIIVGRFEDLIQCWDVEQRKFVQRQMFKWTHRPSSLRYRVTTSLDSSTMKKVLSVNFIVKFLKVLGLSKVGVGINKQKNQNKERLKDRQMIIDNFFWNSLVKNCKTEFRIFLEFKRPVLGQKNLIKTWFLTICLSFGRFQLWLFCFLIPTLKLDFDKRYELG